MTPFRPILALTLGDPAGIGPEVAVRALSDPELRALARFLVFGDPGVLHAACEATGRRLDPVIVTRAAEIPEGSFGLIPCGAVEPARRRFGEPDPDSGPAVLETLTRATQAALAGEVDGLVTAPINKKILSAATGRAEGHTELLARLCGAPEPVMMLAGPSLRVVPATVHARLADVPRLLSTEKLLAQGRILAEGLARFFCLFRPRVAVCALNPHAGEEGLCGREEATLIGPAVAALRAAGVDAVGPLPADTVFLRAHRGEFDAVLAMYHDQAMIPIKLLSFAEAVNVTLGLPIVRTSPAHGTAYDLAGRGTADASSMRAAVRLAAGMARCARRAEAD